MSLAACLFPRTRAALRTIRQRPVQARELDGFPQHAEVRVPAVKGTIRRVSLADCGAIALAEQLGMELVTSDGPMVRVARAEGVAVLPVPDSSGRTPK